VHFQQFYLGCLAHASYLIGSNGEAAVVDPQRDVDQYIDEAARQGLTIRYVIETHLHADFVSGHAELARRTGAEIVFGAAARAEFPHRAVRDGDELRVGDLTLRALETPGHTPESVSWLVLEGDATRKVLTGDTLFIGDVGRPDLAGSRGYTSEQMAALLYDSLHGKLLALADDVEVWPAHGAGSACGKNISSERSSTIGAQRRMNYALKPMTRDAFVAMMTADLPPAPRYFPMDAEINRRGARPLAEVTAPQLDAVPSGAVLVDVRDAASFGAGHIPSSINIGLGGQYASWAGTLLSAEDAIVIVAPPAKAGEAIMRLARVGLENVIGWIDPTTFPGPFATLPQITAAELRESDVAVLDVRRRTEFASAHIPRAVNVPLDILPESLDTLTHEPLAVICAGGYRSSMAASLLARAGFTNVRNVTGGMGAWSSLAPSS
jgi:hydroxyacylglutathione hydrolase